MVINVTVITYNCTMRICGEKENSSIINTINIVTWRNIRNTCKEILQKHRRSRVRQILTKIRVGDMLLLYLYDTNNDRIGLSMVPESFEDEITLEGNLSIEPLIQLKLAGDPYLGGFAHGRTISDLAKELTFSEQYVERNMDTNTIVTVLESKKVVAYHKVRYHEDAKIITVTSEIENRFINPIAIEMVSNFSICGWPIIENGIQSNDLSRYGVQSIHCGQVRDSQVKEYLQVGVVEDIKHGICLGAMVDYDGPWQIDVYNYEDLFAVVGRLRDSNKVHWNKMLQSGENFATPETMISVVAGDEEMIRERFAQETQLSKKESEYTDEAKLVILNGLG